jgi:hypothetical protein
VFQSQRRFEGGERAVACLWAALLAHMRVRPDRSWLDGARAAQLMEALQERLLLTEELAAGGGAGCQAGGQLPAQLLALALAALQGGRATAVQASAGLISELLARQKDGQEWTPLQSQALQGLVQLQRQGQLERGCLQRAVSGRLSGAARWADGAAGLLATLQPGEFATLLTTLLPGNEPQAAARLAALLAEAAAREGLESYGGRLTPELLGAALAAIECCGRLDVSGLLAGALPRLGGELSAGRLSSRPAPALRDLLRGLLRGLLQGMDGSRLQDLGGDGVAALCLGICTAAGLGLQDALHTCLTSGGQRRLVPPPPLPPSPPPCAAPGPGRAAGGSGEGAGVPSAAALQSLAERCCRVPARHKLARHPPLTPPPTVAGSVLLGTSSHHILGTWLSLVAVQPASQRRHLLEHLRRSHPSLLAAAGTVGPAAGSWLQLALEMEAQLALGEWDDGPADGAVAQRLQRLLGDDLPSGGPGGLVQLLQVRGLARLARLGSAWLGWLGWQACNVAGPALTRQRSSL